MSLTEFREFQKIPRLSRPCVVTEKIDGTNGSIFVGEGGEFLVGSRSRWITPEADNHGFALWAYSHREELMGLGPGHHFGEWWGRGIQRGYGVLDKRFSLFNTARWSDSGSRPECCGVVPVLWEGVFETAAVDRCLDGLRAGGSVAAPGWMRPEGVVIYHAAGNLLFKKTLEKDDAPKGEARS